MAGEGADDVAAMLAVWDQGQRRSPAGRGLALLEASVPETATAALARWSIGARDAALLGFHDLLFGSTIDCWLACPVCGAKAEVTFRTGDVRAPATALANAAIAVDVEGTTIRARLPNSHDLMAIEAADPAHAERALFERCIIDAMRGGQPVAAAALSDAAAAAVGAALTAADPQAEILLDLGCPDCAAATVAPFDIAGHLWTRLDHWARAMLAAVDALAARYGWSEATILALSPQRRQAYLDLAAGMTR